VEKDLNRRGFLEKLGAYTVGGAALSQVLGSRAGAQSGAGQAQNTDPAGLPWTAPPHLKNPNILVIMVDQMRWPQWVNASQMKVLGQQLLPNIFGRIRDDAYSFQQYYTAATVCTAARGTLLTGLYAPQTAEYIDGGSGTNAPNLLPAFPTWATGIQALNPAYANNCWWFGKWHLSPCNTATPLAAFGFNTRTYPGSAALNPSPNGYPNEGANGGLFGDLVWASDAEIAGDFIGWLEGQSPSSGPPTTPWCATVSLINPHDITKAPGWLQASPFPPTGLQLLSAYFPPPPFPPLNGAPALYSSEPVSWNWEDLTTITTKPSIQYQLQNVQNSSDYPVTDWVLFLNQYYWLQNYVDTQIGLVLDALQNSPYHRNTIVVFLADHGEYAGSHGLHDKGDAIYDEAIRVPLYVHYPGQKGSIAMNQMCSSVDFFGLVCDLATNGGQLWQKGPQAYPDLAPRQSLWKFLYQNSNETRIAPTLGVPYILHTCDDDSNTPSATIFHIVGLRTKTNALNVAQPGAKLGIYSKWGTCSIIPVSTPPPNYEFYDYNPAARDNWKELGNDYFSKNPAIQETIADYLDELGSWGPPATGLIGTELYRPLVGIGTDGNPLSEAQATAQQNYFDYIWGTSVCTE
jgi:arylsulfatase A-like enzyme